MAKLFSEGIKVSKKSLIALAINVACILIMVGVSKLMELIHSGEREECRSKIILKAS